MAGVLYRLGRLCANRAIVVVAVWLGLVVVQLTVLRVGAETSNDLSLPGTESQQATDPFANSTSGLVSKDATTAFTPVLLDIPNGDVTEELANSILDTTAPARKAGVDVAVGGNLGGVLSKSPTESSEVIGLLAAMLILALTFGSLVAMGMPIITAVLGLATAVPGASQGRRRSGAGGPRPSPPIRWPAGWPRWRSWPP